MNRRDFLSKIPHALAISGAGMFVAAKVLDAQPEVLHVQPKTSLGLFKTTIGKHVFYSLQEYYSRCDGFTAHRPMGSDQPFSATWECSTFHLFGKVDAGDPMRVRKAPDWA